MKFYRRSGRFLVIGADAKTILLKHRQLTADSKESGGILLGRLIEKSEDVVIDEVTLPYVGDKRGRYFFFRKRKSAQQSVNTAWGASLHTRIYLGEWHTHPEDHPSPSITDLENWKRIGRIAIYEQEFLFFIIIGIKTIAAWEWKKDGTIVILT